MAEREEDALLFGRIHPWLVGSKQATGLNSFTESSVGIYNHNAISAWSVGFAQWVPLFFQAQVPVPKESEVCPG